MMRKLLAGLLVATLVLAFSEGLLRLVFGPPPPPVRVYRALGEQERYFVADEGGADHLRVTYAREAPIPAFPAQTPAPRVVVLGGSSIHGGSPGVGPSWEMPGRLEAITGIATLNLGQPGLDSFDLLRMVEELLDAEVRMDALVVYTGHNDYGNTIFEERYGSLSAGLSARALSLLGHSQIFGQLARALQPISGTTRRSQDAGPGGFIDSVPLNDARQAMALQNLSANLRRIAWRTAQADLPLVLIAPVSNLARRPIRRACPPDSDDSRCPRILFERARSLQDTDPAQAADLLRQARDVNRESVCAPTVAQQRILEIAEEWPHARGIDAERLLPADPDFAVPAKSLFVDHLHLSKQGHIALAQIVAPTLLSLLAAEPSAP